MVPKIALSLSLYYSITFFSFVCNFHPMMILIEDIKIANIINDDSDSLFKNDRMKKIHRRNSWREKKIKFKIATW